ncbi:hypothetical protein V8F20_011299 [Naviculisporaceae sp. PSN 640]
MASSKRSSSLSMELLPKTSSQTILLKVDLNKPKFSQAQSSSRTILLRETQTQDATVKDDLELYINADDCTQNESHQSTAEPCSSSESSRPAANCSMTEDLECYINSDHSSNSDSESSDDFSRPLTPPEDQLSPATIIVEDNCSANMGFGLVGLEHSIESKPFFQLHSGRLNTLATVTEAPEVESEAEDVSSGPSGLRDSELAGSAVNEACESSQADASPIAEFSEEWEIIAEWEREGCSAVIAVSNTYRHYWRKGDRYKALNAEEEADLENWWSTCKPPAAWVHPEYKTEWTFEPTTSEEPLTSEESSTSEEPLPSEEPSTSEEVSQSPQTEETDQEEEYSSGYYYHPLPRTGHLHPQWAMHSSVDEETGHLYLIQKRKDDYWVPQGAWKCQACKWVVLSKPHLRRDTTKKLTATGEPVPELIVTSPEGTVGWPEDLNYYPGEVSWADLSDDED